MHVTSKWCEAPQRVSGSVRTDPSPVESPHEANNENKKLTKLFRIRPLTQ
jgi:hypothetical protein